MPPPDASGHRYSIQAAIKTFELCTIAGVSTSTATGYVKAKMPLAKVRAELAEQAAAAADATSVVATPVPGASQAASIAADWDDVVGKINASIPKR